MSEALYKAGQLDDSGAAEEFRRLANRYSEIALNEGIKVVPFLSEDMPIYQKSPHKVRQKATDFLRYMVEVHEETLASGHRALNASQLLWRALRRLSLVPSPDLFDRIKEHEGDVFMIYDSDQTLLFWNMEFFSYASFSIEQALLEPWYNFTKRSPEIHASLYEMALNLVSGKITGTFHPDVPRHEVEEVGTIRCLRTWMELPWGVVLTRDGSFGGVLICQRMRLID